MEKKIFDLTGEDLALITDHTYLNRVEAFRGRADHPVRARRQDYHNFLQGTLDLPFKPYSVCVRHEDAAVARQYLAGDGIKIAAVAGFPDGSCPTDIKVAETRAAIGAGAHEIDFVLNYDALRANNLSYVVADIERVARVCRDSGVLTKMIFETSELTDPQIELASSIAEYNGIDFVKTSTGFSSSGAHSHDLKIMRENFPRGIKPSGGINKKNVYHFLEAISREGHGMIDVDPLKYRIGAGAKFLESLK